MRSNITEEQKKNGLLVKNDLCGFYSGELSKTLTMVTKYVPKGNYITFWFEVVVKERSGSCHSTKTLEFTTFISAAEYYNSLGE